MRYKVGDSVRVITKPLSYKYQYDIGEVFTVVEVGGRCCYSTGIRCIDAKHIVIHRAKNVIGGELL